VHDRLRDRNGDETKAAFGVGEKEQHGFPSQDEVSL